MSFVRQESSSCPMRSHHVKILGIILGPQGVQHTVIRRQKMELERLRQPPTHLAVRDNFRDADRWGMGSCHRIAGI